jgi:hypothetical protein
MALSKALQAARTVWRQPSKGYCAASYISGLESELIHTHVAYGTKATAVDRSGCACGAQEARAQWGAGVATCVSCAYTLSVVAF